MITSPDLRRWAISAIATGFLAPTSVAADRAVKLSDTVLTQRVQSTLTNDDLLAGTSLLVSVVDGVAVVGGPLNTLRQQQRLQELLQRMPGIRDSKTSTWIPRTDRIAARASDPRPQGRVVAQRYESLPPMLFEPTTRRTGPASEYSPLPPPAPPAPQGPPEYPTIPSPAVPVVPKQDLAAAVEEVRTSVPRYSGLTVSVKAGVVTITGEAADGADGWELAKLIRKVPGIDRVIVGTVRER
jgi:osmotically-inducible protein OsmY